MKRADPETAKAETAKAEKRAGPETAQAEGVSAEPAGTAARLRRAALLPVLMFTSVAVSVMTTLGAPLVPTIAHEQGVSLDSAQWMLTVTLLTGAVAAPVMGRLGDGPYRRGVIVGALACVVAGGVLGALSPGFAGLIAGRAMQGAGMGIMPLTIAVARDHFAPERMRSGVALLSVTTSVGAGLGYPITGLIAREWDYRAAFWFGTLIAGLALAMVLLVVPAGSKARRRPLDVVGALLLSGGLTCLLLTVSQGGRWGWDSATVLGLAAGAAVFFAAWVRQALRTAHPLVELRLLANRELLTADVAAVLIGIGLYMTMSLINLYAQIPTATGYGFGLSVVGAGLVLMPLSLGSLGANRLAEAFAARFGMAPVLPCGALVVAADMVFLAFFRDHMWQLVTGAVLLGVGVGTTFAAMPSLIVKAVPPSETGSATSLNAVLRSVGGAIGSAMIAAVLSAYTAAGGTVAADRGYTVAFLVGAGACVLGALAAVGIPALPGRPDGGQRRSGGRSGGWFVPARVRMTETDRHPDHTPTERSTRYLR
ncbi:MFS transporter [Yinghuangia soli]|uniref:MFS transporter n=1 Tax=Yinghuangia soli TaxID=2908204 RepID=A0AA41PYP8_9ACTN|nr:MFS transporter [Yinghuangia soli]MCF2526917.1 MFS transporter [Yinghuangia soli]